MSYIIYKEIQRIDTFFDTDLGTGRIWILRGAFNTGSCGIRLNFGGSGVDSGVKNKKGPRRSPFNEFLMLVATRRQAEEILYLQWA